MRNAQEPARQPSHFLLLVQGASSAAANESARLLRCSQSACASLAPDVFSILIGRARNHGFLASKLHSLGRGDSAAGQHD